MSDDLKIRMPEWARNMYNRLLAKIDAGGGGGGEENVIESISLNGVNVPPDANKNVALAESDPTVPSWAKQSSKPAYTASEVGAMRNAASGVSFGGSEAAYSTNIISMLDTMALYEGIIINTYADANTDNFINGTAYNGILYKLDQMFATGFLTNNIGSSILIYRSGGNTVNFKALTQYTVIPIGTGGTGATTPAGACANIGALRSFATGVAFSGSETNLYQNLESQIDNMNDGEARIFEFVADATSGPFFEWHAYSGTFVRYANKTCSGVVSDQTGSCIVIGCNNGTWTARSL